MTSRVVILVTGIVIGQLGFCAGGEIGDTLFPKPCECPSAPLPTVTDMEPTVIECVDGLGKTHRTQVWGQGGAVLLEDSKQLCREAWP